MRTPSIAGRQMFGCLLASLILLFADQAGAQERAGEAIGSFPGDPNQTTRRGASSLGRLTAQANAASTSQQAAGVTRLRLGAVSYRPPNTPNGALPLLVLFHGAGGDPERFLRLLMPEADRLGLLLVAVKSNGRTWDLIEAPQPRYSGGRAGTSSGRSDSRRVDDVLRAYFRDAAVDPKRVSAVGFSDGATYALSLGLANPQLFTSVISLSPGFVVPPSQFDRSQRVFITHGRSDPVLSFDSTAQIAAALGSRGVNVRFRPFEGAHQISNATLDEGLGFALATAP